MKIKAIEYIPKETILEVEEITLLTIKEAEALPENIRDYENWWWLQSAGCESDLAAYVSFDGSANKCGFSVDFSDGGVRPALKIINMQFHNIGDIISIKNKRYVVIAEDRVLYDDDLICYRFDVDSNDYEKSEIKQIVDKWLEEEK